MTRALLLRAADHATVSTLCRDRDILGPVIAAAVAAQLLLELARRLTR